MKLGLTTLLAPIALLAGVAAMPAFAATTDDYEALREEIWEWSLNNNPGLASRVGDRRGDGKLPDYSIERYDREIAQTRTFLDRLDALDESQLPENLQIDMAILRRSLTDRMAASAFDQDRYILFSNRSGPQQELTSLAYSSPFFTAQDYESYIARIGAYRAMNEQVIARTRQAISLGLTQACEPMEGYAEGIDALVTDTAEKSPLWEPFETRPSAISEDRWAQLQQRGRAAIMESAEPALKDFAAFYRADYAPKCRQGAPGIGSTTNGTAYYDYLVKSFTTTQMTADQVHQLGLTEVARIRGEMEEVSTQAGFDSREIFIADLRTNPLYYATTPDDLMEAASALAKQIDGWMPRLFGTLPRLPYTVLPIPAADAPGNTTAYYELGSLATGQPGIYRVNTTELDQRPLWELPALGLHEAVPGHHHQLALQQELDMHPMRQFGTFFTAFVEGWGLYSERLGIEMGLYDTPAKQMGRLSYEMWRATRLVVDTGLHSKGWSKQQAVDYMLNNTALSPANVDAEVNRYITNPGQALAYKLGELKFRELRERSQEALGAAFDLRAFHDAVLENGAVPLDVLEAHISRWIAEQQAA